MIKTIILGLYVLSATTTSNCSDGCLKCDGSACRLCDFTLGFTLSGSTCAKITLDNCITMNQRGACLACDSNFYLDSSTSKCIAVATTDVVQNCMTYSGPTNCVVCNTGFYLSSSACVSVDAPIANCEIQSSSGKCLTCESGYYLSLNATTCSAGPSGDNCASYTNIECSSCTAGYIKNFNYYLSQISNLSSPSFESDVQNFVFDNVNSNIDGKDLKVCQFVQISNCDSYETFNTCNSCSSGYYLDGNKQCVAYPFTTIINCEVYSNLTTCSVCKPGFFMETANNCVMVPSVDKCAVYTNADNGKDCEQCVEGYYLLSFNSCVPRKNPNIDNCVTLVANAEACASCNVGYRATDDGSKCMSIIPNCSVYEPSNLLSAELTCYKCSSGYFYDDSTKVCLAGTTPFCEIYEKTENVCSICANKYYLEMDICKPHNILANCDVYHATLKNICVSCNSDTYLFENNNQCLAVDNIQNCAAYKDRTSCEKCNDGFYLNNNACVQIPVSENCLQRRGTLCGKCINDFILENGVCKDSLDYIVNECEQDNVNGTVNYANSRCYTCKANTYPLNYKDSYICVETSYMTLINGANLTANCTHFAPAAAGGYECARCNTGFYLDNGSCVTACNDPARATLYKQILKIGNTDGDKLNDGFYVYRINVCSTTIVGCAIAAPNTVQNNIELIDYQCVQCKSGLISRIRFNANSTLITNPADTTNPFGDNPLARVPGFECYDPTTVGTKMVGDVNATTKSLAFCDYYRKWGPILGCTRCSFGYSGVVLDVVTQCAIYINDAYTCKQCNQGYYLASAYECKQVTQIDFCTLYSPTANTTTCTKCADNKYLNGNVCAQRVLSLNVLNSALVLAADNVTCNAGYFKDTSSSPIKCVLMNTNCLTGAMNGTAFVCSECNHATSYLDTVTKLCTIVSRTGCSTFANTSATCTACASTYYLNSGVCVANTLVDAHCSTWSNTSKNKCNTCDAASLLFNVKTRCRAVTNSITNCDAYDTLTTCSACTAGTRLENLKTRCLTIPPADNCAISTVMDYNNSGDVDVGDAPLTGPNAGIFYYTCDKCANSTARYTRSNVAKSNATLMPKYECSSELSYKLGNCSANSATGLNGFSDIRCTSCSAGFYPRDWTNKYTCIENSYFVLKSASVTNCERYQWNSTNYKCTRCTYPYFMQTDGSCGLTCPASTYGVFGAFSIDNSGSTPLLEENADSSTCAPLAAVTADVPYCAIYSATTDYATIPCVKCSDTYLPIIDYSSSPVFFDGYTSTTGRPASPISAHPSISSCVSPTDTSTLIVKVLGDSNISTKVVTNCKYYVLLESVTVLTVTTKTYGCGRCVYGMTGPVVDYTLSNGVTLSGYIKNCGVFTDTSVCSTTFTDGDNATGLGVSPEFTAAHNGLTKYFSCLKCDMTDYIPFAFVTSDVDQNDIVKLNAYYLANSPNFNSATVTSAQAENANRCIKAYNAGVPDVAAALHVDTNNFPRNCALGIVNVNSDGNNTNATNTVSQTTLLSVYCAACNPGYAPVFSDDGAGTVNYNVVIDCVQIDTGLCTAPGNWFNSCESCTHHYDIYTDTIDYTKCVKTRANCFAAYEVGPCVLCKKGYDKDDTGACVQESVPLCATPNNNQNYEQYFHGDMEIVGTTAAYYFGESSELGCRACNANFTLTKITETSSVLDDTNLYRYICNDFKSTPDVIDTFKIDNCATYGNDATDTIICTSCAVNYTLTTDNKCKHVTVSNCDVIQATDGITCVTCANLYFNIGGKCHLKSTLVGGHCTTFADSSALTFAKCTACADGYVLSADQSRCDAIDTTIFKHCLALTGGVCSKCDPLYSLVTLSSGKFCYPLYSGSDMQFDSKCLAVDQTAFNSNMELTCTQCKPGHIIETTNIDNQTQCGAFYDNPGDNCATYYNTGAFSAMHLKCKTCTSVTSFFYKTATFECIARTAVTNCATYSTNFDFCTACSDNYVLSPDGLTCTALPGAILAPNRAPNGGYIQRCTSMATCSSKVTYSGLAPQLSSIFSCHKCSTAGQIPVAVVRGGETYAGFNGLQEFGFNPAVGQRYDTAQGESSVTCMNPTYTAFNIASNKFNFPSFCGAAILNANSVADATSSNLAANVDKTKIAAMCVACAPGYAATAGRDALNAVVPFMVSACTAITNCESSLWFSACSQCKSNYSYRYVAGTGVKYDECISYAANPNCYAVDNLDASNMKCKYCRKGYYLNKDGYCELLHPPRCAYSQFRFKQYYSNFDLANGLFLSNDGIGCQQCDSGFVGLLDAAKDRQVCTQSPYITNGLVTASSKFIPNCLRYSVSTGLRQFCDTCQPNYVLTVEGKCVINTLIPNCYVAYNNQSCYYCNDPYVLVNRKCVAGTIAHCQRYANNEVYAAQVCTTCDDGFFLEDNACKPGAITNCQSYDDANTCNSCLTGFGLVKSKNGIDYCYPIDASLNCSVLDIDNLQNGVLQCKECASNNYVISNDLNLFNNTICMPFISTGSCKTYDINPNVQDSSFSCTSCNEGYFLSAGECLIRTVNLDQCARYSLTADVCLECADNFFLDAAGTRCTAFPDGIAGCRIYMSKSTCFGCEADMFLKNNACFAVNDSDKLAHCVYYDDPQTCTECDAGFIVVEGKCASVAAQNCVTYENTNACDSCPAGYGLKLVSGLLNCVQNNITNCAVGTEVEPFECLVCNTGFYVKDGGCAAVTTPIANCVQYAGAAVCAVCATGSVLSTDRVLCLKTTEVISVLDSNCQEAKLTADLLCNSCKPGYVFMNGVCSSCSKRSLASGCYVCDPRNENTCLMCAPGYYQFDDGRCVKNGLQPDETENPDPNTDSAALLKALAVMVMMLIFA